MKKDMQIYVKTAYLYWYSIGELRILAYGKSAVLREPSAARLDNRLLESPPGFLPTPILVIGTR